MTFTCRPKLTGICHWMLAMPFWSKPDGWIFLALLRLERWRMKLSFHTTSNPTSLEMATMPVIYWARIGAVWVLQSRKLWPLKSSPCKPKYVLGGAKLTFLSSISTTCETTIPWQPSSKASGVKTEALGKFVRLLDESDDYLCYRKHMDQGRDALHFLLPAVGKFLQGDHKWAKMFIVDFMAYTSKQIP